jgi:hypothetical protein
MELQVSIIDGKSISQGYQLAMALTDSEKRIFGAAVGAGFNRRGRR